MTFDNATVDPNTILQESSEHKVKEFIPVLAFVSVLLIIGILGNVLVLIFFCRKAKDNVSSFFIVVLAIVDICACLMISLVIMDLSRPYKYTSDTGCKIHSFSKFFTGLSSILLLFTIAVERYRKICCPFKRQLSMKGARIVVCIDIALAMALSVAQAFLYEVIEVNVENEYDMTVIGFSCRTTRDKDMRKYLTVLNGILFFLFIFFSVALIVLYSLQSRAIYNHNRKHAKLTKSPDVKGLKEEDGKETKTHPGPSGKTSVNNNQPVVNEMKGETSGNSHVLNGETSMSNNQPNTNETKDDGISDSFSGPSGGNVMNSNETINSNMESNASASRQSIESDVSKRISGIHSSKETEKIESVILKQRNVNKETISPVRVSIMFFVITIGFIACFTTFMIYSVRRSFSSSNSNTTHSVSSSSQVLVNSYLINSTLNFFVYAVVHNDFKRFLQRIFCCCRNTK